MSHWNHRVLVHQYENGETELAIHEVYYDDNGNPNGYAEGACTVHCDIEESLLWVLLRMRACLDEPYLYAGDRFPEEYINPELINANNG